ncbi:hypothetical protein [Dactylosporangium darangshiense]|uniref:hypothetical protein n=1 Tax=Dactylosporangium darangshiense TaxID=579108 RepID=UPI0031E7A390
MDEAVEVLFGLAVFHAADLALCDSYPAADDLLGDGDAVVWVPAVGRDEVAHVAAACGVADGRVGPEVRGDGWRVLT